MIDHRQIIKTNFNHRQYNNTANVINHIVLKKNKKPRRNFWWGNVNI